MLQDEMLTEVAKSLIEKANQRNGQDLDFDDLTPSSRSQDLSFEELIPRQSSLAQRLGELKIAPFGPPLREYPRIGSDVISSATLGLFPPKSLTQPLPPVTSFPGQVVDLVGQGAALVGGPAGQGAKLAERGIAHFFPNVGKTILGRAATRATGGVVLGGLSDVTTSPSEMVRRAGYGAALSTVLPPLFQRARRDAPVLGLLNRIGPIGSSRSALARKSFLEPLQQEALATPRLSGQQIPLKIQELNAQFPERQAQLGQVIAPALDSIQQQLADNPSLVKVVLKSAEDSGRLDLVKRIFPETEIGFEQPGSSSDVVSVGRIAFRRQLIQEMRNQGQLPSELRPQDMSFDHVQQLKRVFGDIIDQTSRNVGSRVTQVDVDTAEAYGTLREAELAVHPELKPEFDRHHAVMNSFRNVKPLLSNLDKFEGFLTEFEGGTSGKQTSLKQLLSPSSFLKAQTFSDANQFQRGVGTIARRAAFYTTLFPLYSLFSLIRSDIFRQSRRR